METIRWQGYEYTHHEKNSDWFWALGIIALSSAITAIIFKNILFALLILIGAFTLALFASKKPHLNHFEITRRGISINNTLYSFSSLESFWIDEDEHGHYTLIIKSHLLFMSLIVIPLSENIDSENIRDFLLTKLEEEELEESRLHRILEFFGF